MQKKSFFRNLDSSCSSVLLSVLGRRYYWSTTWRRSDTVSQFSFYNIHWTIRFSILWLHNNDISITDFYWKIALNVTCQKYDKMNLSWRMFIENEYIINQKLSIFSYIVVLTCPWNSRSWIDRYKNLITIKGSIIIVSFLL